MPTTPPREVTKVREQTAWNLRVTKHWTEQQIAEELGVTQQAVSLMLKRVEKALAKQFEGNALSIKAEQTAQLQHMAQEAMAAWERSKENAEMERTVEVEGKMTTTNESRGQVGDPRHLDNAMKAMEDVRDIWGLEAPKKQDVTSAGKPINVVGYKIVPPAGQESDNPLHRVS